MTINKVILEIRKNDLAYLRILILPITAVGIMVLLMAITQLINPDFVVNNAGIKMGMTIFMAIAMLLLVFVVIMDKKCLIMVRENDLLYYDAKISFVKPKRIRKDEIVGVRFDQDKDIPFWVKRNMHLRWQLKKYDRGAFGRCIRLILKNGETVLVPYLRIKFEDRIIFENIIRGVVTECQVKG